jgi:hypothetical protein
MSDEPIPEDADMGPPLAELHDLQLPVGEGFPGRVRNSINRRLLGGDLVELAWRGPVAVVVELIQIPFGWFARPPRR